MLSDLAATARLVWAASPGLASLIVLLSVVLALVPAATLWVGKLLLDQVALAVQGGLQGPENAYRQLAMLLGLQVAIGAASVLLSTLYGASRELLGDTVQNRISLRILEKAASLDVERFENAETYDALRNAYGEVGSRPLGVMLQLVGIGQALVTLGSIGSLMTRLGAQVMPLVLLASIPGVIVSSRFGAESYRMIRRRATEARHQNYLGLLLTSDALVKEVRLFGFERYLLAGWQQVLSSLPTAVRGVAQATKRLESCRVSRLDGPDCGGHTVGPRRAAQGTITVGDFSLFALGIVQVQGQFSNLLSSVSGIYESLLYMRNLFEFLELPSRDLDAGETWRGPIERIEFERVGFRYPLTDRDVLTDVSFRIDRGQALALVGENGAGKTTVVKLLTRLFEPSSGRILLNGLDAARFSPRSVQREMSIIFQDYGEYQMTARENIGLSRTDALGDDARHRNRRRTSRAPQKSSIRFPIATKRCSVGCFRADGSCRVASGSGWHSAASISARRRCRYSTSLPPLSTPPPRRRPSIGFARMGPIASRCSSHTASQPSAWPTESSSCTTDQLSNPAHMMICWPKVASMPRFSICRRGDIVRVHSRRFLGRRIDKRDLLKTVY